MRILGATLSYYSVLMVFHGQINLLVAPWGPLLTLESYSKVLVCRGHVF